VVRKSDSGRERERERECFYLRMHTTIYKRVVMVTVLVTAKP